MKPIVFGIQYVLRHQLGKKDAPLICGLVLTNRCNLRCRHCRARTRGDKDLSFEEITTVIDSFYEKGNTYKCCRYCGDPALCQNCGYLSYAEIDQTLRLRPSAILNALKYF